MIVRALLRRRSYLFSIVAVVLLLSTIVPVAYWATFSTSTSMYQSSVKAYAPDLLYETTAAVAPSSFINNLTSGLGLGSYSNGLLGEALLLENITRRAAPPDSIRGLPVAGGAGTFIVLNVGSVAWNLTYKITNTASTGQEVGGQEKHAVVVTVNPGVNMYRNIAYKSLADFYVSRALKYSHPVSVEAAGGLYLNYTSLPVRIVFYKPGSLGLLGLKVEPVGVERGGGIPVIVNPLLYYLLENITGSPPTTVKIGRAEFRITGLAVSGLEGYLKYWSGLGYYPAGEIYVPRSMLDSTIQLVSDPSGYDSSEIILSLMERARQYGVTPNLTVSEVRNLSSRRLVVVPDLDVLLVSGKPVKPIAEQAQSLGLNLSRIAPVLSAGWEENGNGTSGAKATAGAWFANWYSIVSAYTVVDYNPYYLASKGTAVLNSGLPELYDLINNRSAETYRMLARMLNATVLPPQTVSFPAPGNGSAPACYYSPGSFVPPRIERHQNSVFVTSSSGAPFTLRCRNGWFLMGSLARDSILDIVESNGNVQSSVPVTITYTSIIPGLLVVMGLAIATGIGLLVASSRRWLAVYVARGGDPVRASRRLSLTLTLLSLPIATLGFALVYYTIVAVWGGLGGENVLLLYAASLGLAAATVLLVSYSKSSMLKTIEPGEAVRPLTLLQRSSVRVGGRGMSLLAALSVIVIIVGEARLNPDAIFNSSLSPLVYGLLVIVFMIAFFLGPFTPLLALYYYGKALASSERVNRQLSRATSLVFRRGGGLLGRESGERLLQTVLAPLQALATSIGLMVAGLWISSGIVRNYIGSGLAALLAANDIIGMSDVQGLQNSARLLRDVGYIAGLTSIIIAGIAVVTLYSSIKREVAVLRARGAGRRDTAGFVYASLAPLLVSSIILGFLLGFIVAVAYDSILGFFIASSSNLPLKHVPVGLAPYTWLAAPRPGDLAFTLLIFTVILVLPLIVMLEMLREENIASILRG